MQWLVFALSVVAAGIAFWQASEARASRKEARVASADSATARDEARTARDETRDLAKDANTAFNRSADAQERANEIEVSKLPKIEAEWALEHVGEGRWALRNVGRRTAASANLHDMTELSGFVRFEEVTPRDVPEDDVIEFLVFSADSSPTARVEVRWHEGDGPMKTKAFTVIARR